MIPGHTGPNDNVTIKTNTSKEIFDYGLHRSVQARRHGTANDKDEELQNLIGEFNLARMDLNNEISKSERSDERIAELNTKVNDLYGKIMADEGMTAYNEAKRDCENLVNYIDAIINTAMNGGDPATNR